MYLHTHLVLSRVVDVYLENWPDQDRKILAWMVSRIVWTFYFCPCGKIAYPSRSRSTGQRPHYCSNARSVQMPVSAHGSLNIILLFQPIWVLTRYGNCYIAPSNLWYIIGTYLGHYSSDIELSDNRTAGSLVCILLLHPPPKSEPNVKCNVYTPGGTCSYLLS